MTVRARTARAGRAACAAAAATILGAAAPPPPTTADFVQAAAQSDRFEILEAQVAETSTRDARVRAFAQEMIRDHTRTLQALAQAASASGLPPPSGGLGGDQARLLAALQGVGGPDFDRTYLRHQVLGHVSALAVEQAYAEGGADPSLRQAAKAAVPIIRRHLETAERLGAAGG